MTPIACNVVWAGDQSWWMSSFIGAVLIRVTSTIRTKRLGTLLTVLFFLVIFLSRCRLHAPWPSEQLRELRPRHSRRMKWTMSSLHVVSPCGLQNARASYDFSSNDPYPYPRYTDDWFNRCVRYRFPFQRQTRTFFLDFFLHLLVLPDWVMSVFCFLNRVRPGLT